MKKFIRKAGSLLASLLVVTELAIDASAASRVSSSEAVSSSPGNAVLYILLAVAVVLLVVVVICVKRRKKPQPSQVVVVSPTEPVRQSSATLEAQGTFLGGRHYGIVTHAMIGRSSSADIKVDDPNVSGVHCQVSWENGRLFLMDMDSTNGTMIDGGKKIPPKTKVQLFNGSVFCLGDERLAFRVKIK